MDATRREWTVRAPDGVRLAVTGTGQGTPILFLHEFAGDQRSWAPQVAELAADHRCLTYAARGYLPSDVPADPASYSWRRAVDDAVAVLDALGVERVHVVGLSMGGYTALQLGLLHPDRVLSVLAASVGSGSDPATRPAYLAETGEVAAALRVHGADHVGRRMADGPSRVQLKAADRAAWDEMVAQFAGFSVDGLTHTIVGVQGGRPSLHDLDLAGLSAPLLLVVGDEDEACLPTGLLLKRTVPGCGLVVLPNSGHVPNLENPARFTAVVRWFLGVVASGSWPRRDPRSRAVLQFDIDRHESVVG